ncbi:NUDIX domain-containing protein [Magnetospirillum sp. J10]|uniref:NUDIX domain-containing protein n=2 Tax=Magnetospirillum sulfuroxidans TaxID=611300 RepID=A0ABS5IB97_9PROT|nr:NUDIX domain-containing protein [Magnetospirillum sulfuroxidans]
MNRDYPTTPLPAVLAAVTRDTRLALVQRSKEEPPRRWGLPGGLIELGESPTQAALRELHEETGIIATAGAVIDVFDMIRRDADGRVRQHFLILVVQCQWRHGEGAAASDAAAFGWFDRAAIARLEHVHDALPGLADCLLGHAP